MNNKSNSHPGDHVDDYYASARQKAIESARKDARAVKEHVADSLHHLIPYYEIASDADRDLLVKLNNVLVNRFEGPGMMYWNIFRNQPTEILEYPDYFEGVLIQEELEKLISFLELQKVEAAVF